MSEEGLELGPTTPQTPESSVVLGGTHWLWDQTYSRSPLVTCLFPNFPAVVAHGLDKDTCVLLWGQDPEGISHPKQREGWLGGRPETEVWLLLQK